MNIPVIIIQPPLTQLNTPYPSGAYLSAFFKSRSECSIVRWIDMSNGLFRRLFSSKGLSILFDLSRTNAETASLRSISAGDDETAFQLRRFMSSAKNWISWIDAIVSILCGDNRELCHAFIRSPHAPRGYRMDTFLANLQREPTADDACALATLAIEDLADYITLAFDSEFSLVRYADSLAVSESLFADIEAALLGPVVVHFLKPYLDTLWTEIEERVSIKGKILFCVSVPFPGCLVNALAICRSIRGRFGERAVISMGGGYVNTELRSCENEAFFSYIDFLSFDRGFGSYASWLEDGAPSSNAENRRLFCPVEFREYEETITETIVPDYSDINLSLYPSLADTPNPMHRLWSDGTWIKAYLAHGCYWHRCSFCDVSLDYVCAYRMVDISNLYRGLREQSIAQNVFGIHLVDEAAPPRALRDFAYENIKASRDDPSITLSFWGNIRFEKTFTRDLADFLCAGGLVAVSGGIEIASPEGFKAVDKGIDLENLVAVCAAFKEAGVLVHSYLIYGYWNQDEQGVIDSLEVMRQLFSAGLVDSAFWHKFVLTRHSRVYGEWQKGLHQSGEYALKPVPSAGDFAENDVRFEGESKSERYSIPLETALQAWMTGEGLDTPVAKWFPYPMPPPKITGNLIDSYIATYEAKRDAEWNDPFDPSAEYWWIATQPVHSATGLLWWHLGEEIALPCDDILAHDVLASLIDRTLLADLPRKVFKNLRHHGLCRIR